MADDKCPRLGKWFNGCKFEPRHSIQAPDFSKLRGEGLTTSHIEAMSTKRYECDVCIRCGKIGEKNV